MSNATVGLVSCVLVARGAQSDQHFHALALKKG